MLRLYIEANDGRQATLRYVKAGRILAMMAPFHPMPGTLVAVVNSTVIQFGESAAARLARNNAAFAWELTRALSDWSLHVSSSFANVAFGRCGSAPPHPCSSWLPRSVAPVCSSSA
jgi:hypothetical protein